MEQIFIEQRTIERTITESPSMILEYKSKAINIALILQDLIHFIYQFPYLPTKIHHASELASYIFHVWLSRQGNILTDGIWFLRVPVLFQKINLPKLTYPSFTVQTCMPFITLLPFVVCYTLADVTLPNCCHLEFWGCRWAGDVVCFCGTDWSMIHVDLFGEAVAFDSDSSRYLDFGS